jgi:WD40 repeat protein
VRFAFTWDSQTLATTSDDYSVRFWDLTTKAPISTDGHSRMVSSVNFSPNRQLLASISEHDATILLWNLERGAVARTIGSISENLGMDNTAVAFSPTGELLASDSRNGTIRLWDPCTGHLCHFLVGHSGSIRKLAFSLGGQILSLKTEDWAIRLRNPTTGASCGILLNYDKYPRRTTSQGLASLHRIQIAFSPAANKLFVSGTTHFDPTTSWFEIRLWDLTTNKMIRPWIKMAKFMKRDFILVMIVCM